MSDHRFLSLILAPFHQPSREEEVLLFVSTKAPQITVLSGVSFPKLKQKLDFFPSCLVIYYIPFSSHCVIHIPQKAFLSGAEMRTVPEIVDVGRSDSTASTQ